MNTLMWTHPHTARHLAIARELGMRVVDPVEKRLACGDVGVGALAPTEDIVRVVRLALAEAPARSDR
jgi:phosphopantothenoylcysteine decarboxylase